MVLKSISNIGYVLERIKFVLLLPTKLNRHSEKYQSVSPFVLLSFCPSVCPSAHMYNCCSKMKEFPRNLVL
jgi:hypothetical protein